MRVCLIRNLITSWRVSAEGEGWAGRSCFVWINFWYLDKDTDKRTSCENGYDVSTRSLTHSLPFGLWMLRRDWQRQETFLKEPAMGTVSPRRPFV